AVAPIAQPERGRIYTSDDRNVVPPVPLKQSLPPFQIQTPLPIKPGVLEVVIGETGNVVAAVMKSAGVPHYHAMVIEAAHQWKYKPATLNGVPVLYRKSIQINVKR